MAEKKKNKPAVTKRMHTEEAVDYSLATSPRFKKIAAKVKKREKIYFFIILLVSMVSRKFATGRRIDRAKKRHL